MSDTQGVVLSADMPPEQIVSMLDSIKADGVIDYYVTTDPLGRQWVLGHDGQITKFDTPQIVAYLLGHQSTLHWLMGQIKSAGMTITRSNG